MADVIEADRFESYARRLMDSLERGPIPEAMEAAKGLMLQGHQQNFDSQSTRDGTPWAPRKPPTGDWPILDKTGALKAAATGTGPGHVQEVGDREAMIGVDGSVVVHGGGVHAAPLHQSGTARMPARPFVGASDAIEEEIGERVADAVLRFF